MPNKIKPKKQRCEKCGRMLRYCKLKKHKLNGEMWCRICLHRYGENKFTYYQLIQNKRPSNNQNVSKYSITMKERQILFAKLMKEGMTPEQANRKIWFDIFQLRKTRQINAFERVKQRQYSIKNNPFLVGLGQVKNE